MLDVEIKDAWIEDEEYVQTHKEHGNTMQLRTIGNIATISSNSKGGYYSISLSTGHRINRHSWTPMPIPAEIIIQVHYLVWQAKTKKTITFINTTDEDLDTLYAVLDQDEDDAGSNHNNDKLIGVDGQHTHHLHSRTRR